MSGDPYDDIPLPSEPVLSEEETLRQLRDDLTRPLRDEIARLRSQRDELAGALRKLVDEHESFYVDWALLNPESPDFDPGYRPEFPPVVHEVRAILAKLEEKQ